MLQGQVVSSASFWRQHQLNPHSDDREATVIASPRWARMAACIFADFGAPR
jgi:hypothetical protein